MTQIDFEIEDFSKISIITDMKKVVEQINLRKDFISKTLPITNIKIINNPNLGKNKNVIYLINSNNHDMNFDKDNNVAYMFSKEEKIRLADIVYVLLEMISNQLLSQGKYLLHSSALQYDDNKSILLIGDANAGKTSLAYKLMRDYKYKLISNDHTVLTLDDNYFKALAGTKEIEMRLGVIKAHFPELSPKEEIPEDKLWNKKIVINDIIDGSLIADNNSTIVTDVFQINISEGSKGFISKKDKIDQLLYLYEQLSSKIKGTYNLITGFDYPLPSLESYSGLKKLSSDIRIALDNMNVYMAKGSLDDVSKQMVKILENK